MKPATVKYLSLYKKLFFQYNGTKHDLSKIIGNEGAKLSSILRAIDPKAKVDGSDPVYNRVYRRMKYLRDKGLYTFERRQRTDWKQTEKNRNQEIEDSVRAIFEAAILKDPLPFISARTTPTEEDSIISTVKKYESGFYVRPTGQLFYLFSQVQNSNSAQKSANKPGGSQWWDRMYNIPERCSSTRVSGIKTLMGINEVELFQRDLKCPKCKKTAKYQPGRKIAICDCGISFKPPLNPQLRDELKEVQYQFDEWQEDVLSKELLFDRGPGSEMMRLPVRTRFTDKGRKTHNIKTYDRGWNRANMLYNRGVFVTLTTDPAMHKSLWHANRHLTRAFNRYMSLLTSRKARYDKETKKQHYDIDNENTGDETHRLKYISAYEFQENGLIHLHVVFFGIRYLASMDQIIKDWTQCKQGRIVHVYGIRKEGDRWLWNKEKPGDAEGRTPQDYLRKYLEKALYLNENFGLYWAVNKRFCTMCRLFGSKECEGCRSVWSGFLKVCPACGSRLNRQAKGYRFLGSLLIDEMPTARMIRKRQWTIPETGPGVLA